MQLVSLIDQLLGKLRHGDQIAPKTYLVFQALFAVWSVYWWRYPPDPGKAVLLLAVVATILTIQPQMTDKHRLVWVVIVFILFFAEFRAIDQDRARTAEQERKTRQQEAEHFEAIVNRLQDSVLQSQQEFEKTMSRVEGVTKIATRSLENVTGGNSFAFVVPQPSSTNEISLVVWNHGNQLLSGVTITIAHTQDPDWARAFFQPVFIGTIGPKGYAFVPVSISFKPEEKSGQDNYWIMISAQNGTVSESLWLRRNRKSEIQPWAYSYMVTKSITTPKIIQGVRTNVSIMKPLLRRQWSDETDVPH